MYHVLNNMTVNTFAMTDIVCGRNCYKTERTNESERERGNRLRDSKIVTDGKIPPLSL